MSLEDYNKLRIIGRGSYGEVWLVKHKIDRKQFVLKKMDFQKASKKERIAAEQEAKLLATMRHPNIVAYRDSFENDGFLYIVMGYCEGGDLYTRLKEHNGIPLDEKLLVQWFIQITMALQYMHDRYTMHRDLKTQNIFLTKGNIIKVGDLGIARILDGPADMARTVIGTPYYMSPELFANRPYNYKSDVWALGCCVYEMATLKHAFNAKDMNSLVYKILQGKMPAMPKQYSAELVSLIKSMLNHNPDRRPSVNRILREPYIKQHIAEFLDNTKKHQLNKLPSDKVASSSLPSSKQNSNNVTSVKLPEKPTKIVNDNLDSLKIASDLQPINEEYHENPSLKIASNEKWKEQLEESQLKSNYSSHEDVKIVAKSSNGSGKKLGGLHSHKLPENGTAADLRKNNVSVNANEDSYRESENPKVSEFGVESPKLAGILPVDLRSNGSGVFSVSSLKQNEKVNRSARERRREKKATETPRSSRSLDLVTPSQESVIPDKDKNNDHLLKGNPKDKLREHCSNEKISPLLVQKQIEKKRCAEKTSLLSCNSSSSDEGLENVNFDEKGKKESEINQLIDVMSTLHSANIPDDNENVDTEFLKPGATYVKSQSDLSNSPSVIIPVIERETEYNTTIQLRAAQNHQMEKTLTTCATGRLMNRIAILRSDCIQHLGVLKMKKAYDIMESFEAEELEPRLIQLLGTVDYEDYAGKLWQLKFCEEAAFGLI